MLLYIKNQVDIYAVYMCLNKNSPGFEINRTCDKHQIDTDGCGSKLYSNNNAIFLYFSCKLNHMENLSDT